MNKILEENKFWMFEPKKNNRWLVKLPKVFGINEQFIKNTQRPSCHINNDVIVYNPITLEFYDPIGPSTTQILFGILVGITNYDNDKIETNQNVKHHKDECKELKNGFDYTLEMLDPTGAVIEKWFIERCKITDVYFGDLDYSDDSITTVKITLQPEKFTLLY